MTTLRSLGRSGLFVSPLTLGTMTFANGDWGSTDAEAAAVLDAYLADGGNSVDTADVYAAGASETLLGRLVAERGIRDQVVIATKYGFNAGGGPLTGGSGRLNQHRALEGSLRRLGTDHVDLYWLHVWDGITPAAEVLDGMAALVRSGKIRHYGLSNVPAWFAVQVATLAQDHREPGPIALQLEYSLVAREIEREHVAAAAALGLGIVPWSPLAGGFLSGKYRRDQAAVPSDGRLAGDNPFGDTKFTDANWAVLDVVRQIATELGRTPAEIALAWLLQRPGVDTVLVGARTADHLEAGRGALNLVLPAEATQRLDDASQPPPGLSTLFAPAMVTAVIGGGTPIRPHRH